MQFTVLVTQKNSQGFIRFSHKLSLDEAEINL